MKFLIVAVRMLRTGIKNFFRNAWLSIAATAVMVVALTIMLMAIVLNIAAQNAIKELSKNLKVSVYLKDGATTSSRELLKNQLASSSNVANVEYITRQEAEKRFRDSQQDKSFIDKSLALTGSDTLPESLEVSLTDLEKSSEIVSIAKSEQYKDTVDDVSVGKNDAAKETIKRAASMRRYIIRASIFAAALFGAVSVLIIFNTIRMAIFTRGEEIRIMKLIGATPRYIRGPFLVESCMYGVIAGILSYATVYAFIFSIGAKLSNQAEFKETFDFFVQTTIMALMLLGSTAAGILVAVFSSSLAMSRHLKLKRW